MERTVLTPEQKIALELFAASDAVRPLFYLTGGTALAAFYLHHRYSDDLDFFTEAQDFPQLIVEAFAGEIKKSISADTIEYRRLYDRRIFFFKTHGDELKVEFTYYPFMRLETSPDIGGVAVDSLNDIAANKLMALIDRVEPKDFVDLYFLMKDNGMKWNTLAGLVQKKFQFTLEPLTLGSEFAKVSAISHLPRMIKTLTLEELKLFFTDRARELKSEIFED